MFLIPLLNGCSINHILAENEELKKKIEDFQAKTYRQQIQIQNNAIKLHRERLENELKTFKSDQNIQEYLNGDVPANVVDWLLK